MMVNNNDTYTKSVNNENEVILGQVSIGKLIFLVIITLALSVFGPLSVFAPLPMAVAFLVYGNTKTFVAAALAVITTIGLSTSVPALMGLSYYGGIMTVATLLAFAVSSIISRGEHPVKGLILRGIIVFTVILGLVAVAEMSSPNSLIEDVETFVTTNFDELKKNPDYKAMMERGGEDARIAEMIFSNPKQIVQDVAKWIFSATFVGSFFAVWITLFMLLRNSTIWRVFHKYPYSLKDFVRFKAPHYFIYGVILAFSIILGGEVVFGTKTTEVIGANLLYCLGVFYFFQGMGIYLDLLKFLKITGIMRSILTIMTIFLAYKFIAVIGLFDMFANFRQYFKRKQN